MHILLVNDDGILSDGIHALCVAAKERGHRVSVCAPRTQQSAASQRISLIDPIYVNEYDGDRFGPDVKAFAVAGTPTDCVRLALFDLVGKPVDLVISGINDGYNAGMAVHYSGTLGAATEAALAHLPAMAVSVHHRASRALYEHVARLAIRTGEEYAQMETPPVTVLNINAPNRAPEELKPVVLAPLATAGYTDTYIRRESPRAGRYYWLNDGCQTEPPAEGSDLDLLEKGHVTYTFLGNPNDQGGGLERLLERL